MDERVLEQFWEWAKRPEVMRGILPVPMSEREKENRIREIFGLPPVEAEEGGDEDDGTDGEGETDGTPVGPPAPGKPLAAAATGGPSEEKTAPREDATAAETAAPTMPMPAAPAALRITEPGLAAQIERVRCRLFDELPNVSPSLARLGVRAKGEANAKTLPPEVHTACVRRRLFGVRPADWRPTTSTYAEPPAAATKEIQSAEAATACASEPAPKPTPERKLPIKAAAVLVRKGQPRHQSPL